MVVDLLARVQAEFRLGVARNAKVTRSIRRVACPETIACAANGKAPASGNILSLDPFFQWKQQVLVYASACSRTVGEVQTLIVPSSDGVTKEHSARQS